MKISGGFALVSSILIVPSAAEKTTRNLGIGLEPTDPPTKAPTKAPINPPAPEPTTPDPTDAPVADPTEAPAEAPSDAPAECSTITEIACSVDDFSTLCELVQIFELGDALSGGTWTVFAPNNAAFAAVGETIATLDPDTILDVLLFHAVADMAVASTDLVCDGFVTMANGKDSQTVCDDETEVVFQVGQDNLPDQLPAIIATDVEACNGVIHIVDNVMLPDGTFPDLTEAPVADPTEAPVAGPTEAPVADPTEAPVDAPVEECSTIAEIACNTDDFSTLCELVQIFELGDALSGGTWTVFAPNNAAFAAIANSVATLDPDTILDVLLFHAVADTALASNDLVCDGFVTMANGKDSQTVCDDETDMIFQVGEDNLPDLLPAIVVSDVAACNGVIHVVDNVMLPDGTFPDPTEGPSGAPVVVTVEIIFDGFAPEIGWEIVDANGDVIDNRSVGFYPPFTESATETVDLESGKVYNFTIFDLFEDGLSDPEDGEYSVSQGDTVLVSGGGNFGSESSTAFTTE